MWRFLFLLLLFVTTFAFGQTTFTISPTTPSGPLFRGIPDQSMVCVNLSSTPGVTWNGISLRFRKVVPTPAWNTGNVDNDFMQVKIVDNFGSTVLSTITPSTCAGAVYTSTSWTCEVPISPAYTLGAGDTREWCIIASIPLGAPTAQLQAGFVATSGPNVQIAGGGTETIPSAVVQSSFRQVQDQPPQPVMTLSQNSPAGDIERGISDANLMIGQVTMGGGTGTSSCNTIEVQVGVTGTTWDVSTIDTVFSSFSIVASPGGVVVAAMNPSQCTQQITNDTWRCSIPITYSMNAGDSQEWSMRMNIGNSQASTIQGSFEVPGVQNCSLSAGGSVRLPTSRVLGASRNLVTTPLPDPIFSNGFEGD